MSTIAQMLSSIPGNPLANLQRVDALWQQIRQRTWATPTVITERQDSLVALDWDVAIAGGTLGIFLGAALAQRGWRVVVVERGLLRGRAQEWNISRRELHVLLTLELLTEPELAQIIASEYNPARIAFHKGVELWVEDVLNIGVDPVALLDVLKTKFLAWGGMVLEHTTVVGAVVGDAGIQCQITDSAGETHTLTARLLVDAMGHFSPIARQARQGQYPDAVCLVVGTCAAGFSHNDTGDLLVTCTPIQNQCQYFWEAFPARDGRTTYLFTYLDADPSRPSLESLFEDYLRLLPDYQQVAIAQLQWQRALFGMFPCYRQSPLASCWQRVLHVGDSSGSQSPLSFGGFGALLRHLQRLTEGVNAFLREDMLDRSSLALLQPYQPNLSVTWLFQRTMSVGVHQTVHPDQINQLLSAVFAAMAACGDQVLKPFLQDVVQFSPLSQALARTSWAHPGLVARLVPQLGIPTLMDWMKHYLALGGYTLLDQASSLISPWLAALPAHQQARYQRWLEAWHYGAGQDHG
ncbi:MAG: FAD-binding oxidoreductase [Cyanobacteria bacterium]|nr:FAD-binding oxidoreductase [Cyanobacteriota bacterium]MDW8202235.1 FAD-binding oxidoreductase [Cyanobacteriota bacterium SKYGB_h_bin112]